MLLPGPWPARRYGDDASPDPDVWPPGVMSVEDYDRFARYADLRAFFDGDQWLGRAQRHETRLVFNYARSLIRKTSSYVFPAPVRFSVVPDDERVPARDHANRVERLLTDTVSSLQLDRLDLALATDLAVTGDAAMKVTWDDRRHRPRIVAVDPAALVVHHEADDPWTVTTVFHAYGQPGRDLGSVIDPAQVSRLTLDPERTYPVIETWTEQRWQLSVAGQEVIDSPNPYGWIPYVLAHNDPAPSSVWGSSDLTDLIDVCRELNRRMTVLSRVLEMSGAPIAVLENVDGSEGITVGPGAKWELPEGAKAYLLDLLQGGGTETHIAYIDLLYRTLHDLSETPRTAFGDSGRDLSGAALEVEIQPLVQKVNRKRRMWDDVFSRRNALLLDLMETFGGAEIGGLRRTTPIWPPVLPSDRDSAVRNAVSLVGTGVQSRRSAMAALGEEDPEAEMARILEETGA
ncbi:MAG TPA: phage portal protein [Thermomicrobiales bacterium]|nr:phage portal protein [Thermomicrobiales bacterium]